MGGDCQSPELVFRTGITAGTGYRTGFQKPEKCGSSVCKYFKMSFVNDRCQN